MVRREALTAACLALLLVTAGCVAPNAGLDAPSAAGDAPGGEADADTTATEASSTETDTDGSTPDDNDGSTSDDTDESTSDDAGDADDTDADANASESADGSAADDDSDADADAADGDVPPREERDPEALAREYDVAVEGEVAADPELVFARTQVVLGTDVAPPREVVVHPDARMQLSDGEVSRFQELLGITYPENEGLTAAGYVRGPSRIVLNEETATNATGAESVLAHESVHVVQYRQDVFGDIQRSVAHDDGRLTTDGQLTMQAVVEGSATYAQAEYYELYVDEGVPPHVLIAAAYRNGSGAERLGFGPYHHGYRHVDARVDDATELDRVYERPPRTTAELLHGRESGPAVGNLTVNAPDRGEWNEAEAGRDRYGELFTRITLSTELSDDRAADAAEGWTVDRRLVFSNGTTTSYAWVLRFENGTEADEFEAAAADYLDGRAERRTAEDGPVWVADGAAFRLTRVDETTVALVLGAPGFVEGTRTADGAGANVTVTTP